MANLKDTIVLGNLTVTGRITGAIDSSGGSGISVVNNNPTLSWGSQSTVATVGSTAITLTMPSNPVAGTAGTIPKFTGANTIGDSSLTIGTHGSLQINSGGTTFNIGNLNGEGAKGWIHMYTSGTITEGLITDTSFSSTNGNLGTASYPWKGLHLNGSIYTTNGGDIGNSSYSFNSEYIKKVYASRIEPLTDTTLYVGADQSAGQSGEIKWFSNASDVDNYSSLWGAVKEIPASTWTAVATQGYVGTALIIGACHNGGQGGFVALATQSTLHVSYKQGCVTNVRVNGYNIDVYTNSNVKEMRVLCLKVYD